MEEDEFDEFEEATYSTSTTHAQIANSQLAESSPPIQTLSFNQDGLQSNNIQPFSTLAYNSVDPFQLDMQSSSKSEQVWPHLNKISSVQESTQNGLFLDFTKNSSVKEEINHSEQQQSLNYLPSSTDPVQYNIFMLTNENKNKESSILKMQGNDFLPGFSSKDSQLNTIDVSSKNTTANLFNWQATNQNPSSYMSNQDNYGLFSKTNDKSGQNKQIYPIKQQKLLIPMQNEVFQFQKSETNQNQNEKPIQSSSIHQNINQYSHPQSQFMSMTQVESKDMRKQSEQFVFEQRAQQAILPQKEQNKVNEVDYRWFSKNTHQQINEQQIDQFQVVQVQLLTHTAQQQTNNSLPQQPIQEKLEQPSKKEEEEDDDFGDFQQTTVNNEVQTPPYNSNQQDTTIHIKQEYLNSNQSEFYQNKAKELQHFVDSLPNFSYLFMRAFAI